MSNEGLRFEYTTGWIPVTDPPKRPGWYLVDNPKWEDVVRDFWNGQHWVNRNPTHWRELPPRAPRPDPFEEWWQSLPKRSDGFREVEPCLILSRRTAELVWDAAMKAKEQGK